MEFLEKIKPFYELYIFTQGDRAYVEEIMKYLDKDQSIFGNRILTRDSDKMKIDRNNKGSDIVKKNFELLVDLINRESQYYKNIDEGDISKICVNTKILIIDNSRRQTGCLDKIRKRRSQIQHTYYCPVSLL